MTNNSTEQLNRLTLKQEAFCLNLFKGMSQRDAYIEAGYSPKQLPATIDRHASELAKTDKILARLDELKQKAEDDAISTAKERRKILTQIQRATIADFVDEHGNLDIADKEKLDTAAVAEMKTERTLVGIKTTLKLRDPISSISEHNKMDKVYETSVNINQDNRTINIIVEKPETKDMLSKIGDRLRERSKDDQ